MKGEDITAIVEKAIQGDKEAFICICEKKCKDILFLCIHLMGNKEDGEDAAQEAMIHMQKHIAELRSANAFHVWMYRVVSTICNQMRRKMKRRGKEEDLSNVEWEVEEERREFLPYEYVEDTQKQEMLLQTLEELPYDCKTCIVLYYYEEMSYTEIAEILRVNRKKVDHTLRKAKRLLLRGIEKKSGARILMRSAYGIAGTLVMTQVLQIQAQAMVTPESVNGLVKIVCEGMTAATAATGAAAIAAGGSQAAAGTAGIGSTAAGIGGTAKITLGLAAMGVVTATGGSYLVTQSKMPPAAIETSQIEPQMEEESGPEVEETVIAEITVTPEPIDETPQVIETLEDMIGEEQAVRLHEYAAHEDNPIEELEAFLNEIGLEPDLYMETIESEETYVSYYLTRQDKMLMLIRRNGGISFQFTEAGTPYLQDGQLIVKYEKWR